jgi:7-cyano-7-deazaguanine synthase
MANAIYVGTYHKVRLVAPLQYMMKWEIVTRGTALGAPFHLTHSCYKGAQPACGTCPTCVERLGAFRLAGEHDPIEYAPGIDRESDRYELSR